MEQNNENVHRRDAPQQDRTHDDNRDNRMPPDPRDDADKKTERGPSMIAYSVKDRGPDHNGREQDSIWKSVGAAFPHRDGKGMDVVLDALPVDGRVTLREQRREEFKEQRRDNQNQSRERDRTPSQERPQGRDR